MLCIFVVNAQKEGNTVAQEQTIKAKTAKEKCSMSTNAETNSDSDVSDSVEAFTASVGSVTKQMDKWLIDSGASSHMTWERNILTNYQKDRKSVLEMVA